MKKNKKNNRLTRNEMAFFYNILYLCENDKKLNGFSFNRKELKNVLKKVSIQQVDSILENHKVQKNSILFLASYKKKKYSQPASLLIHMRNAFAHTLIDCVGNSYLLKDKKKNKLTMVGNVEKKLLKELIEELFSNRNK